LRRPKLPTTGSSAPGRRRNNETSKYFVEHLGWGINTEQRMIYLQ
jgi:hypothetical protein